MIDFNDSSSGSDIQTWRIRAFLVLAGVIFVIFLTRLFTFQIIQNDDWLDQAEVNRTDEISIPTQRGVIYDRNGIILARNIPSYNVAVTPANLPDDQGEIDEIIRQMSNLLNLPINKGTLDEPLIPCGDNLGINQMIQIGDSFAPFNPVLLKCDVDRDISLVIAEKAIDWPGVSVEVDPIRDYPTGELTSTMVGFLGPIPALIEEEMRGLGFIPGRDKVGYAGIEVSMEEILRGLPGRRVVEVDVAGQVIRNIEAPIPPTPGLNVVLTIDLRYQDAVDAILRREINGWNAFHGTLRITSGVAIAMNPRTGEILAMVSYPAYENNRLARFIPAYYYQQLILDATQPLLNHAVGAELPAGSVFKIVTSVGALNEGVVEPEEVIQTPGKITITEKYYANDPGNGREFVDWNEAGFGRLDFLGGISNSSNVYFYKIGGGYRDEVPEGLGICRLGTYARAMGYDNLVGIELPDETDGLIPSPTWKRINQGENWSTGDTYISSVGQGFVIATPLQILTSAAIIANDGKMMRPTIVREVVDSEGNVIPIIFDDNYDPVDVRIDEDGNILDALNDAEGNPINLTVMSPFAPDMSWDITKDPLIKEYENPDGIGSCKETGEVKTVQPWVVEKVQEGMRLVVTQGTLLKQFTGLSIPAAGKTGTAEYCDVVALNKGLCIFGNWPTHSWSTAYAPHNDPEIAVIAFLYNGGEGASVAGPVLSQMIEAWFELKSVDAESGVP